jgi:hypothetical protein
LRIGRTIQTGVAVNEVKRGFEVTGRGGLRFELVDRSLQGLDGFSVSGSALAVEQSVQEFPVGFTLLVQLLQHRARLGISTRVIKLDGPLRRRFGRSRGDDVGSPQNQEQ